MSYLPTWIDDLILPKSYGESVVDAIYGKGGTAQVGAPDPSYDPADLSSPNVYVEGKKAVTTLGAALTGKLQKYAIIAAAFIAFLVFIYALAGGLARR